MTEKIKLTQYSHGAGCGCKISPAVLSSILHQNEEDTTHFPNLLVGNADRDDAAVLDLGQGQALISTTDFFMPVVDDPFDFGRIAATNAISDIYAMGGTPVLAIAILGWPVNVLSADIANQVIRGGRVVCRQANIPLAGGHSIDAPEPIFGLAVNGLIASQAVKKNTTAKPGDLLFLTKPLGVGIITTAEKQKKAKEEDVALAIESMTTLNRIGEALGRVSGVHALTDVTGFGLLGHLTEMCLGAHLSAELIWDAVPVFNSVEYYRRQGAVPGGTFRNWESFQTHLQLLEEAQIHILCDPQTSGGLLVAVDPDQAHLYLELAQKYQLPPTASKAIGRFCPRKEKLIYVL